MSKLQDELKEMRKKQELESKKGSKEINKVEKVKGINFDKSNSNKTGDNSSKDNKDKGLFKLPSKKAFIFLGVSIFLFTAVIVTYSLLNPEDNIWGSKGDSLSDIQEALSGGDDSGSKIIEDSNLYIGSNVKKKEVDYNNYKFKIYDKKYTKLGTDVTNYLDNLTDLNSIDFTDIPLFLASEYTTFVKDYIIKEDSDVQVDDKGVVNITFYNQEGKDNFKRNKEVLEKAYKNSEWGIIYTGKEFEYSTEDNF